MKTTRSFNIILVAFLALILIFVSAQQGCPKEEKVSFNTTALVMNFVDNAPPAQLVTNEKYPIYVDIRNDGGYDVPAGSAHFYLSGVGENLKNVDLHAQNVNFLNKKTNVQSGGKERLTFATIAEPWKPLPAPFNFTIRLDSCYRYATVTQSSICVGKGNGICTLTGDKITSNSNSAAPIQVTSLTENIQGNKLYVSFVISNKGTGEVYLPNADCTKLQEHNIDEKLKQNQVEIIVRTEEGFSCKLQETRPPYSSIDALSGIASVGTVTCQKTLTETASHSATFEIVLSYTYRESITKGLTILPA